MMYPENRTRKALEMQIEIRKVNLYALMHSEKIHSRLRLTGIGIVISLCLLISACAGVVVGGAAAGVAVATDRRTTGTVIEDQAIEFKASKALFDVEELRSQTHINVTSYNNVVLVSGEAPTEDLRTQVIDKIRNIEKVKHVYDEITIAGPSSLVSRSSDSLITAKVKTRLLSLPNFDGTRVKVVTENGTVFLMGLLTTVEAEPVTAAAREVGGVQKVVKLFEYVPEAP